LATILLFALGACNALGEETMAISSGVEGAVEYGIITASVIYQDSPRFDVVTPQLRDITTTYNFSVGFHFPPQERLTFQNTGGYVEARVSRGDFVQEGDVLAVLISHDETLHVNHRLAEIRLEQFERNTALTELNMQRAINTARDNLAAAGPGEWEEMTLRLQLAEIQYEVFLVNSNAQRTTLANTLEELDVLIRGEEILAPFDGWISRIISGGTFIDDRRQIVTIANIKYFFFTVNDASGQIRFGDTVYIQSDREIGGVPILTAYAEVVSDLFAVGPQRGAAPSLLLAPLDRGAFFDTLESIDMDLSLAFALRYSITASSNMAPHAPSIPFAAVNSAGDRAFVHVYNNGILSRRYVEVGATTGTAGYTQIISGLDENAQVVVFR